MSKQKFFRGQMVYIGDLPVYMSHFPNNFVGIIDYSYSDVYGRENNSDYSITRLGDNGLTSNSWYEEDQITLLDNDRDLGEEILQEAKDE